MTIQELIKQVTFDDVFEEIAINYPEYIQCKKGFENVFNELNILPAQKEEGQWTLIIKPYTDDYDDNDLEELEPEELNRIAYHVSAIDAMATDNVTYSISMERWEKILAYETIQEQVDTIGKNLYIAELLWDITFWGFDQNRIQSALDDRIEDDEEFKKMDITKMIDIKEVEEK